MKVSSRSICKRFHARHVPFFAITVLGALAITLAVVVAVPGSAQADPDQANSVQAIDSAHDGAVMPTRERRHTVPRIGSSDELDLQSVDLPGSFDLRNVNGVNYVTPVRDQNPYGTCWAFSFCAAAESNYLMETGQTIQLSPLQVAYYTYNTPQTPRAGLEGDYNYLDVDEGFDVGGDEYTTGFSAMSWTGLVDESVLPYSLLTEEYYGYGYYYESMPFSAYLEEDFPEEYAYSRNSYQVHEVSYVNLEDRDEVKAQLMEQGAAIICYYDSSWYLYRAPDGTYSYYQNRYEGLTNHAVTLVGWDDDFDSFDPSRSPSRPGAWLIKNSWGDDWGNDGYFWLSYYDASLNGNAVTFIDLEPVDPDEVIFQYDGNSSWGNPTWSIQYNKGSLKGCANVFTPQSPVQLDQVACYLYGTEGSYQVQIYTDIQDANDPTSGTPVFRRPVSGTFGGEAYLNVTLPQKVTVMEGEPFSVVFSLLTSGSAWINVGTDCSVSSSEADSYIYATGHAEPGQSFILLDGHAGWYDLSDDDDDPCNLRIKAYGDVCDPPSPAVKTATELAGAGRYETAAMIALEAYPAVEGGADGVIIATGKDFPDALGAAGLAGMLDWPILLTEPGNLPQATYDAIVELGASEAIVVGGAGAVSDKVFSQLEGLFQGSGPGAVTRIAGTNRYKTAEAVYYEGCICGYWGSTAIISTGTNYPDALSISGFAFSDVAPIFLCDPKKGLSEETKEALLWGGFDRVVIVGGTGAVPASAEGWIEDNVTGNVQRLAGNDRYLTSKAIAEFVLENGGTADGACIATGANFPDALAGGPLVGCTGSILLLADPGKTVALGVLAANANSIQSIYYLGGVGAVPPSVRSAAEAAAGFL